jgi:hypothetical protein
MIRVATYSEPGERKPRFISKLCDHTDDGGCWLDERLENAIHFGLQSA